MRSVIASVYMTLDGVVAHPENWTFEFRDADADAVAHEQLFACDTLLMGRATYEIFAAVWPGMTDERGFADRMNSMPKYVVSSTMDTAEWNTTVIPGDDLVARIRALKQRAGQDILTYGYGRLTAALLHHGLLDELRVWLHPVLVGSGGPADLLLRAGTAHTLRLVDTRTFPTGLLILGYRPTGHRTTTTDA